MLDHVQEPVETVDANKDIGKLRGTADERRRFRPEDWRTKSWSDYFKHVVAKHALESLECLWHRVIR